MSSGILFVRKKHIDLERKNISHIIAKSTVVLIANSLILHCNYNVVIFQ